MPITENQAKLRKKYLGSSDAAAILGMDPFRSAADVYFDKTGQIQPSGLDHNNDAIQVGNWCEDAVLRWFSDKMNLPIIRNQRRVHENKIMACSMDAIVKNDPTQAIEAKTHAVTSWYPSDEWGEVETDQVPERIALQCYHQMAVLSELQVIWIPVLLGRVGFRHYKIERNSDLIKDLEAAEVNFWTEHVVKLVEPPESMPSMETLKKLKRIPEKTVDLPDDLVARWVDVKKELSVATKAKKEVEQELLSCLGDAEAGTSALGNLTYFEHSRKEYTVQASNYRQLYFKKAK